MTTPNRTNRQNRRKSKRNASRGVALVMTLLLLMLMVAMTLAMTIAVTSDSLINRYYRNYRASFYAADAGVNIAREYMESQLATNASVAVGTTYISSTTPPLSSTDASTTLSALTTAYGSSTSILGGQGASSWPSSFKVVSSQSGTLGTTLSSPTCTVSLTSSPTSGTMNAAPYNCTMNIPVCTGTCTGFAAQYQYSFPYTITAIGASLSSEQQIVEDAGNYVLNVNIGTATSYSQSFAGYGMFIDQYTICSGYLVAGTITGPTFTNGSWTFGNSGSYTFTGKVSSAGTKFGYYNTSSGNCTQSASNPQTGYSTTFQNGYTLGASPITLPSNSFNQKEAAVDGLGNVWTSSTTAATQDTLMNTYLKTAAGTAYPLAGTTNPGVYLSYSSSTTGGVTTNTMYGGGIYVEGDASSVVLTAATASSTNAVSGYINSGDTLQEFTVTQGSTTTTVYVDETTAKTVIKSGSTTTKINGIPENNASGTPSAATMFYVDGNINSIAGPSSGAAVQNGAAITVATALNDNITVTGNITYATEPVTTTQNQIPNTPADTLISGNNSGQVLGMFTPGGNVNLDLSSSNQNLEIDASIATIVSGGSGGIVNTGSAINTLTIVGGRIQNTIQDINTTTRNVWFDQRFASGGFAPPWFPSTTVTPASTDSVNSVNSTVQQTQWLAVE